MVEQQTQQGSQETRSMKVYELAKELGVDSISLVDKLGALNIKVKNHMSELGPQEVETARNSFAEKQAAKAAATKAKTAKPRRRSTKAAAPKTASETPAGATAAGAPTTKTTKPVRRRRSAAETGDGEAASAAEDTAPRTAAPIIRRRTKESGATTETVIAPSGETTTRTTSNLHPAEELAADQRVETEGLETQEEAQHQADMTAAETQAPEVEATSVEAEQTQEETPSIPVTPRSVRPTAPRKSFLKIVEATAPPPRPMIKPPAEKKVVRPAVRGTTTQDKDGFRITKITKENLDQMVEEEAAKKRGGGKIQEVRPEDVRFADYRKKEMVFLPKRKKIPVGKDLKKPELTTPKAIKRVVEMQGAIGLQDFAAQMNIKAVELIRKLMGMGQMVTMNQTLDFDTATLVANEYGYEVKDVSFKEEALLDTAEDRAEDLKPRPPVVTIMGHVDHGKTSLLDAIRSANVVAGEAGGITQHIGAYTVEKDGKLISFIDTPGHEAFTVMRARGANVTDIVILVVAADDGVMPQTREALNHAQAAGVPIIVAINKIDRPQANPERVKQQLSELNLLPEDWGGQTMFVPVSAIQKTGLENLLESILLQAEVLDLKANPSARASGTVLEARLEKGRGPVVSVLVSRGTLRIGDPVVSGSFVGKVKAMLDDKRQQVKKVTPGLAVEVLGFEGVPNAGERFDSPESDSAAKAIVKNRSDQARSVAQTSQKMSLDDLFSKIQSGNVKELNVILKADVFGSVEAVRDSLTKLSNDQVTVKVIHSAAGGITESDVLLATASNAIIIGFNVRPETKARQLAEAEHVDIKCYNIIYELIDEVKKAMTGLLDKKKVEKFLGRAEVRQTFSVPKIGMIAGSAVIDGKMVRGASVRLLRDSRVIFEGKMSSLKRFKDDAKEVATGYECGIGIENYNDLKPGDVIEAFEIESIAAELNI